MPRQVLVQVTLNSVSALPEDVIVNTFHFASPTETDLTVAHATALADVVAAVYDTAHSGSSSKLGELLSELLSGTGTIKVYDLGDSAPRVPTYTRGLTFTPVTTGDPLPREVACCLSYSATVASGETAARRRGRIFFGPFNSGSNSLFGRPQTSLQDCIKAQANYLLGATMPSDYFWAVRSGADDASFRVTHGYIDNSWDTQRRRGEKPTARTLWP